ncbi:MAG: DUF1732 domain-containing protein [Cytophagales bacterium]|nr:DUF1732 domain-containing protein [Cytophagales bacterium]
MISSMTGFGNASKKGLEVSLKTWNAKYVDISLRLPWGMEKKEPQVRDWLLQNLKRGKVSLSVRCFSTHSQEKIPQLNFPFLRDYLHQIKSFAVKEKLVLKDAHLLQAVLQLAHGSISQSHQESLPREKDLWKELEPLIKEALEKCLRSRAEEGKLIQGKLTDYVQAIQTGLTQIAKWRPERDKQVRAQTIKKLRSLLGEEEIEIPGRVEQEIHILMERMSIEEEHVRLQKHVNYFSTSLLNPDSLEKGKKLTFICQEIGRELNTLGAKCAEIRMQREVINMKTQLEDIKEQVLNLL